MHVRDLLYELARKNGWDPWDPSEYPSSYAVNPEGMVLLERPCPVDGCHAGRVCLIILYENHNLWVGTYKSEGPPTHNLCIPEDYLRLQTRLAKYEWLRHIWIVLKHPIIWVIIMAAIACGIGVPVICNLFGITHELSR
jgi:hypothetical protein